MALSPGERWVVLDLKLPETSPGWLVPVLLPIVRPFAVTEEVIARRPWDAIRAAMQARLTDHSWTELFFGFAFLAAPGAFLLISCSEFQTAAHDDAHHAFMTLPIYTRTRGI